MAISDLSDSQYVGWKAIRPQEVRNQIKRDAAAIFQATQGFRSIRSMVLKASLNADADEADLMGNPPEAL